MSTDTHTEQSNGHVTDDAPRDPMERAKHRAKRITDANALVERLEEQVKAARKALTERVREGYTDVAAAKKLVGGTKAYVEAEIGDAIAKVPASIRAAARGGK